MNTGEVLDLFKVSAEGEPGKAKAAGKASAGSMSAARILEG
jgi:TATA-binding protein-associated factor